MVSSNQTGRFYNFSLHKKARVLIREAEIEVEKWKEKVIFSVYTLSFRKNYRVICKHISGQSRTLKGSYKKHLRQCDFRNRDDV